MTAFVIGPLVTTFGVLLVIAGTAPEVFGGWSSAGGTDPVLIVIGAVCAGFFGVGGAMTVRLFFKSSTGLWIDAEGFTDAAGIGAAGRVPWGRVTGWRVAYAGGHAFLHVRVDDDQVVLAQMSPLARLFGWGSMKMDDTPVTIQLDNLQGTHDEILNAFRDTYLGLDANDPQ